jgi:AcrR family transcriptional regulator
LTEEQDMTTTRASKAEQTKQQILATAHELFIEYGYDASSLQMIADAMGVTKAAVYYHFHTKAEILRGIASAVIAELSLKMDEVQSGASRRERVTALVNARVDQLVLRRDSLVIRQDDPGIKRELKRMESLQQLIARGLLMTFGASPTPEDRAAYGLFLSLDVVVAPLSDLALPELRDALRRTCFRLLRVPYSPYSP